MTNLIRIPCEDGPEYDLYVFPPENVALTEALATVEKAIDRYFQSSGEDELVGQLEAAGFTFPMIYQTEGTW